jgi:hypothetical protein
MDTQRIKSMLILLMLIVIIGGATFFITIKLYGPTLKKEVEISYKAEKKPVRVVVAKTNILIGTEITGDQLRIEDEIPGNAAIENGTDDVSRIIGKMATSNIYKNQQISLNYITEAQSKDLKPSDRYITVDIPTYSFVNNKVDVGSFVDILVDRGNGKYAVVLAKTYIYDKKTVGELNNSSTSNPQDSPTNLQPAQLNPSVIYGQPIVNGNNIQRRDNPSKNDTKDYRVQLKVTERQQKRLFQAMTEGKLMTRLYVLPEKQKASIETYVSSEETTVVGDGIVK